MNNEEEAKYVKAAFEGMATGVIKNGPPVYADLLKPATKQIGKTLELVTGAVNIGLLSIGAGIFGWENIQNWLNVAVVDKLKDVPPENIVSPKGSIAGPSIEAMRFLADEKELQDLYAQLIASSMNKETSDEVHPAFVDMIKNLSPLDANIFNYLVKNIYLVAVDITIGEIRPDTLYSELLTNFQFKNYDGGRTNLSSLMRLGLIELRAEKLKHEYVEKSIFNTMIDDFSTTPYGQQLANGIYKNFDSVKVYKIYEVSPMGKLFAKVACGYVPSVTKNPSVRIV